MAQDITGLWKGTLYNDTTKTFYKYEIGISREKGKLSGFSHTWFILDDKQYYGIKKVKIKLAEDGKILVEDDGLIANNYPVPPSKNVRQLNVLTLQASDSIMKLTGPFTTNRTKDYHPVTGTINLERRNDFWQSALVPHLQELGREKELNFVKEDEQQKETEQERALAENTARIKAERARADEEKKLALKQQEEMMAKNAAKIKADRQKAGEEKQQALKQQEELMAQNAAKIKTGQEKADDEAKRVLKEQEKLLAQNAAKIKAQQQKTDNETKLALKEQKKAQEENAARIKAEEEKAEWAKKEQEEKEKKARMLAFENAEMEKRKAEEKRKLTPAADVNERRTILQQTVSFSSDSLLIALYDNGEVDGDTVSVLMNGQLILAKQGLTTTAIKKTIYIPAGTDKVELIMYAESLGSIPPNTGLLVIRDGKNLYEIRFSGDLQKNASIVFNRKKE
jgi:hypothetical protein